MNCKAKIELIDPDTEEVKVEKAAKGIITNAYKYISTLGYPFTDRTKYSVMTYYNADVIAQGCIAFNADLGSDENDTIFDFNNVKTAFGSRYTSDMSQYSTKYGAYRKDLSTYTDSVVEKVWEWGTQQGNGTIRSVALTHSSGADCFDTEYLTSDITVGNDYMPTLRCPFGDSVKIDGASTFSSNQQVITCPEIKTVNWYESRHPRLNYYVTENNIIQLCTSNGNTNVTVKDAEGKETKQTKILYRVIPRKEISYYPLAIGGLDKGTSKYLHPLSRPEYADRDYVRLEDGWDGEIIINTGTCDLIEFDRSTLSVEDSAFMVYLSRSDNAGSVNPDGADAGASLYGRMITYVISGDTPTVSKYDSIYNSPLFVTATTSATYLGGNIVFTKDLGYIYNSYRGGDYPEYNYIAKRFLNNDELAWKINMSNTKNTSSYLNIFPCVDGAFEVPLTGTYPMINQVRKTSDGSLLGYCRDYENHAYHWIKDIDSSNIFLLVPDRGDSSTTSLCQVELMTNYLFCKINFDEDIVKTDKYKMRITVTIEY